MSKKGSQQERHQRISKKGKIFLAGRGQSHATIHYPSTEAGEERKGYYKQALELLKRDSDPKDVIDYLVTEGVDKETARALTERAYDYLTTPMEK